MENPLTEPNNSFLKRARAIKLDAMTWENSAEPLSERFWRRYGANAMELLDAIKLDESQAELLIESAQNTLAVKLNMRQSMK